MRRLNDKTTRKFKIGDISEILHITKNSFKLAYSEGFFLRVWTIFPDLFIVCEVDGKIGGFTFGRTYERFSNIRPLFLSVLLKKLIYNSRIPLNVRKLFLLNRGHVILTAISPNYRRMGIASTVITRLFEEMKKLGLTKADTLVRFNNIASIKMCKKLGFKEKKIMPILYEDKVPRILLEKRL